MGCSSVNSIEEDVKLRQKNINLNINTHHHKKDLIHAQSLINLISRIRNKMIYLYHKLIYDTGACLYLNPTIAHCLKSVLYKVSCDLEGKFENAGMEYMEDPPYLKIPNKNEIKKETKDLLTELFNFIVEIKNYKTIIKQIDRETPGLLYLIFENKENVSSENIDNINKGIELFKEMTNLRTSIINKYKLHKYAVRNKIAPSVRYKVIIRVKNFRSYYFISKNQFFKGFKSDFTEPVRRVAVTIMREHKHFKIHSFL